MQKRTLFISVMLLNCTLLLSQDGLPDYAFGVNGKVITNYNNLPSYCSVIKVLSDGKILAGGSVVLNNNQTQLLIIRYNSNGSIDQSFTYNGFLVFPNAQMIKHTIRDMAIMPNGNILAVGEYFNGADYEWFEIEFVPQQQNIGYTKLVTWHNPAESGPCHATKVKIQSDGKVIVAGTVSSSSYSDFALFRYNTNGTLDYTFGTNGRVLTSFGWNNNLSDFMIQSDGSIVAVGSVANQTFDVAIAKYLPNGQLDPSFDGDGKLTKDLGDIDNKASSVIQSSDGKIIVGGYARINSDNISVQKINQNGTPDNSFGFAGFEGTFFHPISTNSDYITSMLLLPNGKFLTGGYENYTVEPHYFIARHLPNGMLDPSFDVDGIANFSMKLDFSNFGRSIALQPDGKALIGGTILNSTLGVTEIGIARLQNAASIPTNEILNEHSWYLSPNPATHLLYLMGELPANSRINIFTLDGRLIKHIQSSGINNTPLDIEELPVGMYFMKIDSPEMASYSRKFIKQ